MKKLLLYITPYPNPAKDVTSINYCFSSELNEAHFVIMDDDGNIVKQEEISQQQGKLSMDVSGLDNGIYSCSFLLNEEFVTSKKLIIEH